MAPRRRFRLGLSHFASPSPGKGQWIVILGANGAGKTTILRSLALGLRNLRDPAIWPKGAFAFPWNAIGGPGEAKITIEVEGLDPQITRIRVNGSESFSQSPPLETPRLFPLFAYGCRRGSALGGAARALDLDDDDGPEVATLFDERASLIHADTWLVRWHSDAADRARAGGGLPRFTARGPDGQHREEGHRDAVACGCRVGGRRHDGDDTPSVAAGASRGAYGRVVTDGAVKRAALR